MRWGLVSLGEGELGGVKSQKLGKCLHGCAPPIKGRLAKLPRRRGGRCKCGVNGPEPQSPETPPQHKPSIDQTSAKPGTFDRDVNSVRHTLPPKQTTPNTTPLREPTLTITLGENTSAVGLAHRYVKQNAHTTPPTLGVRSSSCRIPVLQVPRTRRITRCLLALRHRSPLGSSLPSRKAHQGQATRRPRQHLSPTRVRRATPRHPAMAPLPPRQSTVPARSHPP